MLFLCFDFNSLHLFPFSNLLILFLFLFQLDLFRRSLQSTQPPDKHTQTVGGAPPSSRILSNKRSVQPIGPSRIVYSSNSLDATFWTAPLSPISITLAVLLGFVVLFLVLGRQQESYEGGETYRAGGDVADSDTDLDTHLDWRVTREHGGGFANPRGAEAARSTKMS